MTFGLGQKTPRSPVCLQCKQPRSKSFRLMHSKRQDSNVAVCLSIARSDHHAEGENVELKAVERQQLVAFTQFNAKRSAGRVERYFLKVRSKRAVGAIIAVGIVFVLLGFFFTYDSMSTRSAKRFQEVGESMMESTRTNIFFSLANLFYQTHYFGLVLSDLMSPQHGILIPSVDTAVNVTQVYLSALTACADVSQYGLGLNTGAFIACQADKGGTNAKLIFANTTKDVVNPEYVWNGDENGLNEDYPWTGGTPIGSPMNATARIWYQLAVGMNQSLWTSIYYGLGTLENVCVVSEVTPIWDVSINDVRAVIKAEVEIAKISALLNASLPSNMSRFAIVNDNRELVAVSGNLSAVDFYRGDIVTKTITQLVDPVWAAVTQAPEWNSQGNFTLKTQINGQDLLFSVSQLFFEPVPGTQWSFYSVLCMTDILQHSMSLDWAVFYFAELVFFVAMIFIIGILYYLDRSIHNEKTRMLTTKHGDDERHVKPIGPVQGINTLRKLVRSHGDRDEVRSHIRSAIVALGCASTDVYFDRSEFYTYLEDKRLARRFTKIYGGYERGNPVAFVQSNEKVEARLDRRESTSVSQTSSSLPLSPIAVQEFADRGKTLKLRQSEVPGLILRIVLEHNSGFDEHRLTEYLGTLMSKMDANGRLLLLDSLEFANITLKWRISPMLADTYSVFPVFIALIIWRYHMQSRKDAPNFIDRYFDQDMPGLLSCGREVLINMYMMMTEDALPNWKQFESVTMEILTCSVLGKQFDVMTMCHVSSPGILRGGPNDQVTSLMLCRLVFIAAAVSYVFHGPDTTRHSHRFINADFDEREEELGAFIRCMFNEYIQPLNEALGVVCERSFVKKFHESYEVSTSTCSNKSNKSSPRK